MRGAISIFDSTISHNITLHEGGGIFTLVNTSLNIERSTIFRNSANNGGGIEDFDAAVLRNVTIYGNTATTAGGGIAQWNDGYMTIYNTTISNNIVIGNNYSWAIDDSCTFNAYNSIISAASGKAACRLAMDCGNNNIATDSSCGSVVTVADPLLEALHNNGGLTWTQVLLPGSPAIDAGDNTSCEPYDQPGKYRPVDGNGDSIIACDIGAFEKYPVILFLPLITKQ